tara:strand:+ start:70 stop:765 length:696 start_codon:yes stop_codon:yes gene_type:complete
MGNNFITAFLPCRKGSQRVPRKNIRNFANHSYGLIELKINQLINTKLIDSIILSTNDQDIINYARRINNEKIKIDIRKDSLCSSNTSTDELISYVKELIPFGHILWTHVTAPFFKEQDYDKVIKMYNTLLEQGFDSLMTSTVLNTFLWYKQKPINYDRLIEKWPRTQTLEPVHEINSSVFLASSKIYSTLNDRIGLNPFLFEIDKIKGFDIDIEEDFFIAEKIYQSMNETI